MRPQAPCKECLNREVGCHAVCKDYIQFQSDKLDETNMIRESKKTYNEHMGYITQRKIHRERAHR